MANTTGSGATTTKKKKTNKRKTDKKKNPVLKAFKIFFITLLCAIVIGSVAALGMGLAIIKTAPALDVNGTILNLDQPSVLYDDKNQIMDTVITTQKRTIINLDSVPKNLTNAFISIEDQRFYQHKGIDVKRIIGAMFINVKNKVLRERGGIQGASTITQELIKQRMFLADSLQNRISWRRKIQEAYLATELEKQLTKNEILEAYVNAIYLGGQANGVQAASKQYFDKDVKDLNLIECAFIAGLPQSPSAYYPFSPAAQKNPSIYINRTKTVLQQMHDNNYINDADYSNALNDLDSGKLKFHQTKNTSTYTYQWFSSAAVEQVKNDLKSQYSYTDEQVNNLISDGGLKIYTTMDRNLQDSTQTILNNDASFGFTSRTDSRGIVEPQAAATLVNYRTGEVKALVGGRGAQPIGSYNRAYGSNFKQAVGSTIKPLTVYAPALEEKLITPATIVEDSPLSASVSSKYSGYQPNNDDYKYNGPTTIRDAIKRSVNIVAVKIEDKLGISTGAAYGEKFGLQLSSIDKGSIAALSLGELNPGSNTTTMASAYGTFGNSGLYTPPRLYTKVVDKNGNNVLENSASPRKVISPQTAYIMYDLLKGPLTRGGTGTAANFGDMPAAGKTGTSTKGKNVWFCGLTPYYSGAVWIGNDNQQSAPPAGSSTSAKVWGLIMKEATKNLPVKDLQRPAGIEDYNVNAADGKLMNNGGYSELFLDGTAPTEYSKPSTPETKKDDVNTPVEDKSKDKNNNNTNSTNSTNTNSTNNTNNNGTINSTDKQNTSGNKNTTNAGNSTNSRNNTNGNTTQQTNQNSNSQNGNSSNTGENKGTDNNAETTNSNVNKNTPNN